MRKIVQRFLKILTFFGLSALGALVAAAVVALRHIVNSPQALESALPGNAHIYRWKLGHIFYKTLGDEDAPPLVLLHAPGIGASAYEMRKIMEALAQQYHVYALDLLGFGLSDHPQMDYSAEIYINMCHDFLTEVVEQPATLLASGLSCNYAAIVATRFPETSTNLVLISPLASLGGEPAQTEIALMPDAGTFVHEEYPALVIANILGWREEGKAATARVEEPVIEKPAVEESGTSETEPETEEALMTYCVKCKKKTPMQDAQEVTTKNGNPAIKGKCSICGTGQFRMGRLSKETI